MSLSTHETHPVSPAAHGSLETEVTPWISPFPPSRRSAITLSSSTLSANFSPAKPEDFNCLFCYCPLYALGDKCGGNFAYVGDGIKDCSGCLVPHGRGSYSYITKKFPELAELARKKDTK